MDWKFPSATFHTSIPQVYIKISNESVNLKLLLADKCPTSYTVLYVFFLLHFSFFTITAKVQIKQIGEGVIVHAPSLGLQEVYIDRNTFKVTLYFTNV